MSEVVASAPGKLVLLGEYAVLEGAPAVTMAVDRRAGVTLRATGDGRCSVRAPDVVEDRQPFVIGAGGLPNWSAAGAAAARLNLVDEVLRGLAVDGLGLAPGTGFELRLDTSAFFDAHGAQRQKLGLGSSAALTVALASALAAFAGHGGVMAERDRWLVRVLALHRQFQGGQGSGVDVATSLVGGVLAYRLNGRDGQPDAVPMPWPSALHRAFIWSGNSASTPKFLSTLRSWRQASAGNEADYGARMAALTATAEAAVSSLVDGDAGGFLYCAGTYGRDLRALGRASGVDIWSSAHEAIAAIAARHDHVVYKPCGAGGGDVGVLFATDPDRLAAALAQLAAAGFDRVPLTVDPAGLRLEVMESEDA